MLNPIHPPSTRCACLRGRCLQLRLYNQAGPLHVVLPWGASKEVGHPFFQKLPVTNDFKRLIQPARGDAVVFVVWVRVVNVVILARQDHIGVLEGLNKPVRPDLVRPFVDLVGQRHEDAHLQEVNPQKHGARGGGAEEREGSQHGDDGQEVVPVGLNDIVAGDCNWVDVVFTEGADEGGNDGRVNVTPCVKPPMQHPRKEISGGHPQHRGKDAQGEIGKLHEGPQAPQSGTYQGRTHHHVSQLKTSLGCGVA
mmetsp:Transcript_39808/g.100341  ORF Transcript_39808/g.100341 Transcript_39808/m.100341 type:complete len:252 (-) Transcript_39808:230-985(-)